jgi:hypothetical protein
MTKETDTLSLPVRLLNLSDEAFITLLESGSLYELYPQLEGVLFNVGQFRTAKQYHNDVAQAANTFYEFLSELSTFTGANPEDILAIVQDYQENLILALQNSDLVDLEDIVERIMEEQESGE